MSKEVILNHERAVDGEVLSEQKEEYLFKGLDGPPSKVKVVIRCIGAASLNRSGTPSGTKSLMKLLKWVSKLLPTE